MKNITSIYSLALVCFAALLVASCGRADGEFTGSEYMPDMSHSIAYEANLSGYYVNNRWDSEEAYRAFVEPRKPVAGTVARGYLPFEYENLEDFRDTVTESHTQLQEKVRALIMADPSIVNPIRPTSKEELAKVLQHGGELYATACQVCHGKDLDGNGIIFNGGDGKYTAKPANFVSDEFIAANDGRFINAIVHGRNMMQQHTDKLTPNERWKVIHYIRSMQAAKKGVEYNPLVQMNVAPVDSTAAPKTGGHE